MKDNDKLQASEPGGVTAAEDQGKSNLKGGRMAKRGRKVGHKKGGKKRGHGRKR